MTVFREETKRLSSIKRKFRQFDIYTCNLEETCVGSTMDKVRMCVIIQQPLEFGCDLLVAPIRTPHENVPITDDNVDEYVQFMREKKGRVYVPIKMYFSDENPSMIDLTKICPVNLKNVLSYKGTIDDPIILKRLQDSLCNIFNIIQFHKVANPVPERKRELNLQKTKDKDEELKPVDPSPTKHKKQIRNFPDGFAEAYEMVLSGDLKNKDAALILGIVPSTFSKYKKLWEERNGLSKTNFSTKKKKETNPEIMSKIVDSGNINIDIPTGFTMYYKKYKSGNASKESVCKRFNLSKERFEMIESIVDR